MANRKILDRRMIVILLIVFVQIVGASMVLPILPLQASRHFGMSPESVTLLITAFFIAQFFAGPFLGQLSDRYGRIPILIISQVGTVISFLMLGLAQQIWVLYFARILDGITGGNIIVAQAYVTDITPKEDRTRALGYIFAAFGSGFVVGPALGGVLSSMVSYETPYFVAAGAAAIVVLMTWFMLEETVTPLQAQDKAKQKVPKLTFASILQNVPLLAILGIAFGAQFAFSMLQSTFSLFSDAVIFADNPEQAELGVGLLFALLGIGQIFTQLFFIKWLISHFGESSLVFLGGIIRGVSMFILVSIALPWTSAIALFLFATGTGIQMPSLQSMVTQTVSDQQRGAVLGIYQSITSLSIIFGSALAGWLFSYTPKMPYMVGGIIFAIMLVPAFFLMRWSQRQIRVAMQA